MTPNEGRINHEMCSGTKRDGSPCTTISVRETSAGLRCRHHDPNRAQEPQNAPRRPSTPRPPLQALRSPQDAALLSSWAAIQSARGRLNRGQAQSILQACREFRQAFRDSGIVAEFEQLKATVARLTAKAGAS